VTVLVRAPVVISAVSAVRFRDHSGLGTKDFQRSPPCCGGFPIYFDLCSSMISARGGRRISCFGHCWTAAPKAALGDYKIVSVAQHAPDLAAWTHFLDAERVILNRGRGPAGPLNTSGVKAASRRLLQPA
jgi:hypothetical protein